MRNAWIGFFLAVLSVGDPEAEVKGVEARVSKDGKPEMDISLTVEGAEVVSFEMSESTIRKFTDDRGTDLGAKPKGTPDYAEMPIYASSSTSSDSKARTITVTSPKKASEDASEFTLEGDLVIKHAEKVEKEEQKDLKIEEKASVSLGGLRGRITDVKTEDDLEFKIEFETVPEGLEIKEMNLRDSGGKELRGGRNIIRSRLGGGPEVLSVHFYGVKPPVEELTLECEFWVNVREMRIPYQATAAKK